MKETENGKERKTNVREGDCIENSRGKEMESGSLCPSTRELFCPEGGYC